MYIVLHGNPSICEVRQNGVLISGTPENSNLYDIDYSLAKGSQVRLKCCPPNGNPPPSISWTHPLFNQGTISFEDSNRTLVVSNFNNLGFYQCLADNVAAAAGKGSPTIQLRAADCSKLFLVCCW